MSERSYGDEVATIYVDGGQRDRYVVSLVVGYADEDLSSAGLSSEEASKLAAAAALDLTRDTNSSDTTWFVYDRVTEELRNFEQGEFEEDE